MLYYTYSIKNAEYKKPYLISQVRLQFKDVIINTFMQRNYFGKASTFSYQCRICAKTARNLIGEHCRRNNNLFFIKPDIIFVPKWPEFSSARKLSLHRRELYVTSQFRCFVNSSCSVWKILPSISFSQPRTSETSTIASTFTIDKAPRSRLIPIDVLRCCRCFH